VILGRKFPMFPDGAGLPQACVSAGMCAKGLYFGVSGDGLLGGGDGFIVPGTPPLAAHPDVCFVPGHHEADEPGAITISEVDVLPLLRPTLTYHH
jgi:hypothetical protein